MVFFMFIIVEYQPFITSKYHQNHAEKTWILNTLSKGRRMARENHKKGIGVNFGFSGNNDSNIIPKTSRYHTEGRELVKISVLKGRNI